MIKSRRLSWADHVARTEEVEVLPNFKRVHLQERDLKEGLGVDGRPIFALEWILNKYVPIRGIGLIKLWIGFNGEPL